MQFRQRKAFRALPKYKNNHTLSQGGLDIGSKVGILAEIGYMLHKCALVSIVIQNVPKDNGKSKDTSF